MAANIDIKMTIWHNMSTIEANFIHNEMNT